MVLQGRAMDWHDCMSARQTVDVGLDRIASLSYWKLTVVAAITYLLWEQLRFYAARQALMPCSCTRPV